MKREKHTVWYKHVSVQYTQSTRKNHSVVLLILKLEINNHLITHTQSSASPRYTPRAQIKLNETNNLARVSNRKSERRNSD